MIGKRLDERNLCADLLEIQWSDENALAHREIAALEDISSSGACIKAEQPIPVNTTLTIHYPGGKLVGRVKHCEFEDIGYYVGIEFQDGYRWSNRKYKPKHLLQFRLKLVKAKS
jgi:PilZ domain